MCMNQRYQRPALQKQRCRNHGYRSSDVETMDTETMDTETMGTETGYIGNRDGKNRNGE